ncbi:leucine-rich melanocyte differentiation-associated protein isoform X1 [Drosophila ficusphila]|uniref:leucine-rich melanocyte differentiation-associated protein isoform X1 n=1 Tax=Drosophila ficusphila TaxID=30025 RepID=UPI0007E8969B|nr:leucine-rich melanocyte differentiation-associated protein isoform X1 [Drosophila ficusphila]
MQTPENNDNQLILVQQNLRTLPQELVRSHADHVEHLDLSHNCLKDLSWLGEFEHLRHLVLDSNRMHEAHLRTLTRPLPQLEILMLNKNEFSDLPTTIRLIRRFFPNLEYLSLHGNPICPDGLELQPFSSYLRYDYEYYSNYIAQSLSKLKFLDHGLVQRTYQYESFPLKSYAGKQLIQTTSF